MDAESKVKPKPRRKAAAAAPRTVPEAVPEAVSETVPETCPEPVAAPAVRAKPRARARRAQEEFDLSAACKLKSAAALEVIEAVMLGGENERSRFAAAQFIIERGYGKSVQQVDDELDVSLQISRIERVILKP
ncbi:MAG TPA: hypothetical protein VF472_12355 [Burkholderiaceae bacterium]